jgi:hypothetical protein
MIDPNVVPSAAAEPEYHADFLELSAIRSSRRSYSFHDYVRDLHIGNASEVLADSSDDEGEDNEYEGSDNEDEEIAQAAFAELDDRRLSFGFSGNRYPFDITSNTLTLRSDGDTSLYVFLALLSWYGKDAGPAGTDGEKIFEEVSAKAAEKYLGGDGESGRARSVVFGFPRTVLPAGFAAAVNSLCGRMREGGGHRGGRQTLPHQKDGKLDVVAWLEFHDNRQGKLITFGQCATGENWTSKITELPQPHDWCSHWMADKPLVWPVRSFFVPHRVTRDRWADSCTFGGILYDRCRIASLVPNVNGALNTSWSEWSADVLKRIREEQQ